MASTGDVTLMFIGMAGGGFFGALLRYILGYIFGLERAFMLRLQAQTIMVQVQIERNTRDAASYRQTA